jgi:hypothetical protein
VFHYQCVINRLKAGWPGARMSFEFVNCSLCQKVQSALVYARHLAYA